jgi:hypothetical protein
LGDCLGGAKDVSGNKGVFVSDIVVVSVGGHQSGVANQFLECLALAHELDELSIGRAALVHAVVVFGKEFFEGTAAFLGQELVDFALGKTVLVSRK